MSMNIFNCMSGEAVLVNDSADSRTVEQNCFTRCCGNCRFTHCETRAVSNESNDTSLPTPTCAAINQQSSGENTNCCCNRCCNRCCCRNRCCNNCRNRCCCNHCCCRHGWFF